MDPGNHIISGDNVIHWIGLDWRCENANNTDRQTQKYCTEYTDHRTMYIRTPTPNGPHTDSVYKNRPKTPVANDGLGRTSSPPGGNQIPPGGGGPPPPPPPRPPPPTRAPHLWVHIGPNQVTSAALAGRISAKGRSTKCGHRQRTPCWSAAKLLSLTLTQTYHIFTATPPTDMYMIGSAVEHMKWKHYFFGRYPDAMAERCLEKIYDDCVRLQGQGIRKCR